MPSSGACKLANASRKRVASRSASAASAAAAVFARLAFNSSKFAEEINLRSSKLSPRVAWARASSALARACASVASDCLACISSVRLSSSSSTWPLRTRAPTSTGTFATRKPASSTPSDISCHAATAPEATVSRSISCIDGRVAVTVNEEGGGFGSLPRPEHAVSATNGSAARISRRESLISERKFMSTRYAHRRIRASENPRSSDDRPRKSSRVACAPPIPPRGPRNIGVFADCAQNPAESSAVRRLPPASARRARDRA